MYKQVDAVNPVKRVSFVVLVLCLLILTAAPARGLEILIGSAQVHTFNYQAGRMLCRLVDRPAADLTCRVIAAEADLHSSDQVHTLTNVQTGAFDLGIVDSAVLHEVDNRSGRFEFFDIDLGNVRSMFSLHGIPFTVVARGEAGIRTLADLKGQRVNLGNPGSPQRSVMDALLAANGWRHRDFSMVEELPAAQSQDSLALCFGTVDAVVRFNVHPDPATRHMVELCGAELVEVAGPEMDKLIADRPFYSPLSIPPGLYPRQGGIPTFGLLETVVASGELDEDTAYQLVKTVFEQLDDLRRAHPAFAGASAERMHSNGLGIPLHAGAERYYREQGWLD